MQKILTINLQPSHATRSWVPPFDRRPPIRASPVTRKCPIANERNGRFRCSWPPALGGSQAAGSGTISRAATSRTSSSGGALITLINSQCWLSSCRYVTGGGRSGSLSPCQPPGDHHPEETDHDEEQSRDGHAQEDKDEVWRGFCTAPSQVCQRGTDRSHDGHDQHQFAESELQAISRQLLDHPTPGHAVGWMGVDPERTSRQSLISYGREYGLPEPLCPLLCRSRETRPQFGRF